MISVVAIGAHPDDVEHSCLGTLLLYRASASATVLTVTTTSGERGALDDPRVRPSDVARKRQEEAASVAECLGGRYVSFGQPDQYLQDTPGARDWLVNVLRGARADVVFAPPPVDYHLDHMVTSQLAYHATVVASNGAVQTEHPPLDRPPALFYVEPVAGLEWQPTHYVDISQVFERKCALLRLHASQMTAMRAFAGWDLVHYCQVVNAFRGLQCGAQYAEAYRPAFGWPRLTAGALPGLTGRVTS